MSRIHRAACTAAPYVSGYESVMQVHNAGHWEDLHNVSGIYGEAVWTSKAFYIEFSGYK